MPGLKALLKGRKPVPQRDLIYDFMEGEGERLLVILDACRLDFFVKHLDVLRKAGISDFLIAISSGSCTADWFENTFKKPLKDVVYISANPQLSVRPRRERLFRCFSRVSEVWRYAWDEELGTVRAGKVSEAVRIAFKRGAEKVIAHYMQPHPPFVPRSWLNVPYERGLKSGKIVGPYRRASKSPLARREFVRAYDRNVIYVMDEVAKLVRWLIRKRKRARVVITSDHGECFGRWAPLTYFRKKIWRWLPWLLGIYKEVGHPCGRRYPELIYVPWAMRSPS